jgi:hypothetical protein
VWTLPPEVADYRERKRPEAIAQNDGKELTEYEMDMRCFNWRPWRDPAKFHFLLRAMEHQWGDKFLLEQTINGVKFVNFWAVRIVKEMCRSPIINLMGCGSSGKTHLSTCVGYTIWKSVPYFTSVYLSTTTGEGADARAWATVNQIYRDDKFRFGKLINSTRTLVIEETDEINEDNAKFRDLRNAIKCVLIPTGNEGRNVVGAISGRKNKRVIWIADEFPHMDLGVMKGRTNLFTNATAGGWAQFVGCGNGPKDGDAMFIDAEPEKGWHWVNKDEHWRWTTRAGICLYFNGAKSPNMRVERGVRAPFPGLMDWEARDLILNDCWKDENTPEFWTQFFGFPPSVQIADTVLTKAFMVNNGAFNPAEWSGEKLKVLGGFDPGFRKDGDPCCAHFAKVGKDIRGKTVAEMEGDAIVINPDASSTLAFEAQIAKKFVDECEKRGCHDIALDVTGDGGIMLQGIEREARSRGYVLNCLALSFSGTAEDKVVIPGQKKTAKEMFDRMVSQIWGQVRNCVGNGVIRGLSERGKATEQFCQRKFITDEKKRFSVESKRVMKQRLKRSPDQADAAACCVFLALRHGLSGVETTAAPVARNPFAPKAQVERKVYTSGHGDKRSVYTGR